MSKSLLSNGRRQPGLSALTRDQFWYEHVVSWRQSGLTQSGYCRREGLKLHQWHYWRKKLDTADQPPTLSGDFVPVQVTADAHMGCLSVTLPNGVVIEGISRDNVDVVSGLMARL